MYNKIVVVVVVVVGGVFFGSIYIITPDNYDQHALNMGRWGMNV
jgi:hypothetical protein